jgi:hypothetical protein
MESQMGGTDALEEATVRPQYSGRHLYQRTTPFFVERTRAGSGDYYIQIRLARFEILRAVMITIKAR